MVDRVRQILDEGMTQRGNQYTLEEKLDPRATFPSRQETSRRSGSASSAAAAS
jgi:hypothetical protein